MKLNPLSKKNLCVIPSSLFKLLKIFFLVIRRIITDPLAFNKTLDFYMKVLGVGNRYEYYLNNLPMVTPLNLKVSKNLSESPRLNILIPGMAMKHMSGGPNTAINLTYRLAMRGISIRFISTDTELEVDQEKLWHHFSTLSGITGRLKNVEIVSASDRSTALEIGENDVFFGTAWWTVQMIKYALPLLKVKKFIYLIQEFEPSLYSYSSAYALALETYSLDFFGVINERCLADYFFKHKIGQFSDPDFIKRCIVFEPAVDESKFYPARQERELGRPKRLLFYARPNAPRNLFELGLNSLNLLAANQKLNDEWEILFIGESLETITMDGGMQIKSAPWLDYDAYASLMRNSDVILSLMLSPHTSYPPIEMAATGGIVVTSAYDTKSEEILRYISRNIITVQPTIESIFTGISQAVELVNSGQKLSGTFNLPKTWDDSFKDVIPEIIEMINRCRLS